MSPDDERHGTVRGYIAHQRASVAYCPPCTAAKARYDKSRKLAEFQGRGFTVPSRGARRRVEALRALGWSRTEIAQAAGWSTSGSLRYIDRSETCTRTTHNAIVAAYNRLSMTIPPEVTGRRVRTWAKRKGLVPPLAWDDIDNDAAPSLGGVVVDVDPVVVMRLLQGDRIQATKAEKEAAMAQWIEQGGSQAELCGRHGWHQGRYGSRLRVLDGGAA